MSKKENNNNIGIFLPPSPRGPGMIKSPPLDITNLIAILKENTRYNIKLIDFRIHSINKDSYWEKKGINLNIFNDFKRCFNHISVKEESEINYMCRKIIKEINLENIKFMIFSVAILEQFSLQYLVSSLCVALQLKRINPSVKIAFFGNCPKNHASKIIENFKFIDAFLEDGNEYSLLEYVKNTKKYRPVDGISYREKGKLIYSLKSRPLDLNKYPIPDFSLFNLKKYKCNGKLILPYEISRGCINNCFFCYYIHKGRIVYKDINKVTDELKYLSHKYDTEYFHFMDAEINFDEKYLEKLCEAFIKKLPHIQWSALAIPNIYNALLEKMKKAGCVQLRWGVEYASERMLKIINKKTDIKGIKQTLKNAYNLGIYNYITLLSGLEIEKEKDIEKTEEFIRDMSPYIDSAKECAWGELGHFSIVHLENLLDNKQGKKISQKEKYRAVLKSYDIPSEDIIEVLAKKNVMCRFIKGTIILSNHCNQSCTYCYVKKNKGKRLNKQQIRTFIKWFIKQPDDKDYKKLNFFGGEPFLEFDLLKDAILFFKKHNTNKKSIIDTIPTNGTILTKEILDFIKKEKLRMSFSLDGDRISNFARKFKNGKNCFDAVWNNMKKFREFIGYPPLIKMTVLPSNVENLYSNIKFLVENGFYKIWPNPGVFTVKWTKKNMNVFVNEYKKILNFYLKNKLLGNPIKLVPADDILINSVRGNLKEKDFFCGLGEEPILSFDGNIYACDSVLLGIKGLIDRFKVGEIINNNVNIDLNKMRFFQKFNVLEECNLKNKNHFLGHLFRRRPCFAIDKKGRRLRKNYIKNILDIHLIIFEMSLNLFDKYRQILRRNYVKNIRILSI